MCSEKDAEGYNPRVVPSALNPDVGDPTDHYLEAQANTAPQFPPLCGWLSPETAVYWIPPPVVQWAHATFLVCLHEKLAMDVGELVFQSHNLRHLPDYLLGALPFC